MRRYEVRMTPSAMSQISDAVSFVRDDLDMPQAAARLLEEFEGAVMGLASMPSRFHTVDAEPLLSAGVRRMNVRRYSVFYRVDEASLVVDVFAVFYGTPSDERIRRVFAGSVREGR
ncbi:type II toxin-antitoxin system RelE/ParE family toxin [Olsenella intestinalis]|uniref:type II toxin-antitoxin system RelE/ParE family toxin n=1 Tax=Olsenella intestinalis TaxID=2930083 RepID=UPI00200E0229